jgi:hypothetical protein
VGRQQHVGACQLTYLQNIDKHARSSAPPPPPLLSNNYFASHRLAERLSFKEEAAGSLHLALEAARRQVVHAP